MLLKTLLPTLPLLLPTSASIPFSNNTSSTANASASAPTTTPAPALTPGPLHCDITYCVNGTSYCHFWAGATTWQMTGPSPGELVTTLGVCKLGRARTTTATTAA